MQRRYPSRVRLLATVGRQVLTIAGGLLAVVLIMALPDPVLPDTANEPIESVRGRIVALAALGRAPTGEPTTGPSAEPTTEPGPDEPGI